ncbi:MAG TPA: hypothetical protein VH917_04410 [Ignavibacteriaceae bacterium]
MAFKTVLSFLFINLTAIGQWEAGVSFNYKSEMLETGIGINVSRNLPIQFASFGIKSRIDFDYFFDNEDRNNFNADLHADILAVLFYNDFQPYFGLSLGGSRYSINDFDEYIFFLGSLAGIKFLMFERIHLHLEAYLNNYFSDFSGSESTENISSLQAAGRIGIIFRL